MKKRLSIIAVLLLFSILLPSCKGTSVENTTAETTLIEDTTAEITEVTEAETTSAPELEAEMRLMMKPYIDIEFTEDGKLKVTLGEKFPSIYYLIQAE